jgi:predicted nucleic acid-binding protein
MKLYAVIDTNVLVSALLRWDSVPGAVLEQALIGSIVPLLSDELTQETTILTGYLDELRMAANRRPFVHVLIIWRLSPVTHHYPHS